MSWLTSLKTAGALALSATRLLLRLLYILSTPLRWPLYYIYASIAFLLSPIWVLFSLGLSAVSSAIDLITRFKYFYIYFACAAIIGICAGFMLHGTSSFIFVMLGIDTAAERRKLETQQHQGPLRTSRLPLGEEKDEDYDRESSSSTSGWLFDRRRQAAKIDANDMFEKRVRLLRTGEQPRSRRRGLLEQTIHEESSESDL